MDPKELKGLMEAYSEVYAPIDENRMASRKALGLGEATAMAKRGKDETAIRNKIASSTGGGQSADRAGALADRPTYGQSGTDPKARANYARKQMGDFRKTNSSNPGLHGYGHKSNDPDVKAKQAARGAQRGSATLTPNEKKQLNMGEAVKGESSERRRDLAAQRRAGDKPLSPAKGRDNANKMQRDINYFDKLTKKNKNVVGLVSNEEVDLFDTVLEFLYVEGYAETLEEAEWLMANVIDEEAIDIILGEEQLDELSVNKMLAYVEKGEKNRADLNKKWDKGTATYREKMRVLGREEGEARASNKIEKKTGKRPYQMNALDKARYAVTKEDYVDEAQVANRDPDKYEAGQQKKSAPVRGEKTPMPPRGNKRREDFEKWYAANVR